MRYLIGSGFIDGEFKQEFARIWFANTARFSSPSRIVILSAGGHRLKFSEDCADELKLTGDLGHFMALVNGQKPHKFNGWMGAVLALALIAYNDESDFIYKEADCLAFGPWVDRMYHELGDGGIIFGRKHLSHPWMPCSQSLFLVKHSYIPEFVRLILSTDAQNKEGELGEHKFERMEKEHSGEWKMMTFGYDRERPFNTDDEVFYVQQITREELELLRSKSLI